MTEFSTMIECGYFPECSGCEFQKNVSSPPLYEEVKDFFSPVEVPLLLGKITGWRMRAKLAVRGSKKSPKIGLFKLGTHDVVPIPTCPLHHASINILVREIERLIVLHGIEPYQEASHKGLLRYLQFVVARESGCVQVTLVLNSKAPPATLIPFLDELKKHPVCHSIWLNFQPGATNTILSSAWELFFGAPYLEEAICGNRFFLHPACFSQAHLSLFERLVGSIQNHLLKERRVAEFYAGIGAIGFALIEKSRSVVCSEINPFAKECFEKQKDLLSDEKREKISFVQGSAESTTSLLQEAEVVIVDPPRKGMSDLFCQSLIKAPHLEQIIYVSCHFPSFKRDAKKLGDAGWKIEKAESYLLFPGTNQVEVLAYFSKSHL